MKISHIGNGERGRRSTRKGNKVYPYPERV